MADEKDTTADIDDWLDDLDDSDEFSAELDQDNIDALLDGGSDSGDLDAAADGGKMEEGSVDLDQSNIDALLGAADDGVQEEPEEDDSPELDQSNIDLLLGASSGDDAPQEAAAEESVELDQDNIDSLLSGGDDALDESGELDQDNIDSLLSGGDDALDESGELDQDNIDALLSGGDDAADESGELDQDNIDALLSGGDDALDESGELDQDNIDSLFSGGDDALDESGELDQDNIDALLSGGDDDEDVLGEEAFGETGEDGLDVDQDEIDQLFSGLDDEDDVDDPFEDDDLDFADVVGEEGDDGLLDLGEEMAGYETVAATGDETVASLADEGTDDLEAPQSTDEEEKRTGILPFLPPAIDRTVASVIMACLVLLIGVSFFFFGSGGEDESAIIVVDGEQVAQTGKKAGQDKVKNYIPEVADSSYQMPESGGEVAVLLTGQDEDGDPLTFEITSQPQHGRLSGELPSLTYLPNSDFPGEDRFEYTVSDGKDTGNLASVLIGGPNLLEMAAKKETEKADEKKKSFRPRKPVVLAKNVTYKTKSTDGVTIDWAKLWREVNHSAYSPKVHIVVDTSGIQGKLSQTGPSSYRYQPDPFFDGKEVIT